MAVWLGVQAFENIGMNLGLTPVTGLPLPFVSYGGSSMVAAWLAVGLVGNVSASSPPGGHGAVSFSARGRRGRDVVANL